MRGLVLISMMAAVLLLLAGSLPAAELETITDYQHTSWHHIWYPPAPENTASGGDMVYRNGKWVYGYFTSSGRWVPPIKTAARPSSQVRRLGPIGMASVYKWSGHCCCPILHTKRMPVYYSNQIMLVKP